MGIAPKFGRLSLLLVPSPRLSLLVALLCNCTECAEDERQEDDDILEALAGHGRLYEACRKHGYKFSGELPQTASQWQQCRRILIKNNLYTEHEGGSAPSQQCLLGARDEERFAMLGVMDDSLCCAVTEILMARRPTGYCPDLSRLSTDLPFAMRCTVDASFGGVYVPDKATVRAAAHQFCQIQGCEDKALRLAERVPALGETPHCSSVAENSTARGPLLHRFGIAVFSMLCVSGLLVLLHFVVTPLCISYMATHATNQDAIATYPSEKPPLTLEISDISMRFVTQSMAGEQESPSVADRASELGRQPIPTPIGNSVARTGDTVRANLFAALPKNSVDVERAAWANLMQERARCTAHVRFLSIFGSISAVVRVLLTFVTSPWPPVPVCVLVLAFCSWQLGMLARAARTSFPTECDFLENDADKPNAQSASRSLCGEVFGSLRTFAMSTVAYELFVLASAAWNGLKDNSNLRDSGDGDLKPIGHFLLEQSVVIFAFVRFYVAWLARSLHRLRGMLILAVLPEPPEALQEREPKATESGKPFDPIGVRTLPPEKAIAWKAGTDDVVADSGMQSAWARLCCARRRILVGSCLIFTLVLVAASAELWRAHMRRRDMDNDEIQSSCRTAARGLHFCVELDYFGLEADVASIAECCRVCDETEDCHAWSFHEHPGGKGRGSCSRMRFMAEPCKSQPSHFSCRCSTSADRVGGYRLSSGDKAWVGQELV